MRGQVNKRYHERVKEIVFPNRSIFVREKCFRALARKRAFAENVKRNRKNKEDFIMFIILVLRCCIAMEENRLRTKNKKRNNNVDINTDGMKITVDSDLIANATRAALSSSQQQEIISSEGMTSMMEILNQSQPSEQYYDYKRIVSHRHVENEDGSVRTDYLVVK